MRNQRDALSRVRFLILILVAGVLPGTLFGGCTSESATSGCRTVLNCKDDAAPICDASSLSCRACQPVIDDIACANRSAGTPICGTAGRCIGCTSNTDCKTNLSAPRCDVTSHLCTTCLTASDCDSNVCNANGACAPPTDVLYVNNANSCSGTAHSGAKSDPFCTIQDAVNYATTNNKSIIAVTPSATPYDAVSITTVGATGLRLSSTTGVAASVQISARNVDAISVSPSGDAQVVVSGFDIASMGGVGVTCSGDTSATVNLTITSSNIHHNINGIVSSHCTLTLDQLKVYKSDNNGISMNSNTTYTINNVMLWLNNSSGIALTTGSGTMRFLTLYANGNPSLGQPAGISCGASTNKVEDSIVYKNVSQTGFDQQIIGCSASNVVTDDSTGATYGATVQPTIEFTKPSNADPSLVDLSLKTDSTIDAACCIDKVQPVQGMPLIDHDVLGAHRPNGNGYDIGAVEYYPH